MNKNIKLNIHANNYSRIFLCILNELARGIELADGQTDITRAFLTQTMPLLISAVQFGENILNYTDNPNIIDIARKTMQSEMQNIKTLKKIYADIKTDADTPFTLRKYQYIADDINEKLLNSLRCIPLQNCCDKHYLQTVRYHYKASCALAQNALKFNVCNELKPMLYSMANRTNLINLSNC